MLRRPETQRVAEFLYSLLISGAPSKDYATRVAERMGLPYPSLARYWQGKAVFPAGLVRSLFLATDQDPRVAEFFLLEGSDFGLQRVQTRTGVSDLPRALMVLSQIEGELSGLYLRATREDSEAGRSIGLSEARALEESLRRLCRTADDLRELMKRLH